jgi:hypothetical protein
MFRAISSRLSQKSRPTLRGLEYCGCFVGTVREERQVSERGSHLAELGNRSARPRVVSGAYGSYVASFFSCPLRGGDPLSTEKYETRRRTLLVGPVHVRSLLVAHISCKTVWPIS